MLSIFTYWEWWHEYNGFRITPGCVQARLHSVMCNHEREEYSE